MPTLLTTIDSATEGHRLAVFLSPGQDGSVLELHEQSWGEGVGWYTQSRVRIDRDQLPMIRQALAGSAQQVASPATANQHGWRVVHADSA